MTELRRLRADLNGFAKRLDALERATPDPILPNVRVYTAGPDGFRHSFGFGMEERRIIRMNDRISLRIYRTVAGGVSKTTVALVNGEDDMGVARLKDLVIQINGTDWNHFGRFVIVPGGCLAKTFFTGGTKEEYWEARGEMKPVLDWVPDKMREPILEQTEILPYRTMWAELGWNYGGQGIDPDLWFDWRRCPEGYARAWQELEGTNSRNPVWYTDDAGKPQWRSNVMLCGTPGHNVPDGYGYDLDEAARWWPGARDLAAYGKGDFQHLHRHYRAALMFRDIDPFAADICAMMLNHCKLAWHADDARDEYVGQQWAWTLRQLWLHLDKNPGPHRMMGRDFAWVAFLAWTIEPDGQFARDLEECVKLSADPRTGISFTDESNHYANFAREPKGPFGVTDPILQSREANFLEWACRLRPALQHICRKVRAFLGDKPAQVIDLHGDFLHGDFYGPPAPFWPLRFGNMGPRTVEGWIAKAKTWSPEAHGSQPMNHLPRQYWEHLIDSAGPDQ